MFIVNVEGAIYKRGKWLLIKRSEKEEHAGGTLSLVGGKCELEGHSTNILERTIQREVFEEVGVEISILGYVNSSSFVTDKGENVIDIVFLCKHQAGEPYAKSRDEVDEVYWVSTAAVLAHPELPDFLKRNVKQANEFLQKEC